MGEGHPPAAVRRALWWCVGCAVLFTAFAVATTQIRALRAHSPWQDDPYDVVVSFTQMLVPALAVALVVRILNRRPGWPRPAPGDLLRGGWALVGMVAATAATDWIAVGLRVHEGAWDGTGRLLIAALAGLTLAVAGTAATMWWAIRRAGERARLAPE
ncbi:hypothetical protein DLE60_00155, partial [Micromonospora globispora]|uniref:hypothetical protein n=1 Tax=Micromonospora globispora TaxID=1450148 RepID=UPI000D8B0D5C